MKNMIKDALILFAITLAAGLLLGLVNNVTKDPIAIAKENAKQAAFREVFSDADNFSEMDILSGDLAIALNSFVTNNETKGNDIDGVVGAYKNNELIGFVVLATNHEGYGGDIQLAVGIDLNQNKVNGISILSIEETAGLGMEAPKVLVPQFGNISISEAVTNHKLSPFSYTKSGKTSDMEIDAISGATITTKAVLGAVNYAVDFYVEALAGGAH